MPTLRRMGQDIKGREERRASKAKAAELRRGSKTDFHPKGNYKKNYRKTLLNLPRKWSDSIIKSMGNTGNTCIRKRAAVEFLHSRGFTSS